MKRTFITLLFLFFLGLAVVNAQTLMYLEIPDIEGESQRANFEDQIEIDAFSFSIQSPKSKMGSGRQRSTPRVSGITLKKKVDIATNPMLDALTKSIRFDEVKLSLINSASGQNADSYLTYTLTNAVISSYNVEGTTEDNKPREDWLIYFEKLHSEYTRTNSDGSPGDSNEFEHSSKMGS
ncbi:type VI secretion system Hcp family effector [Leeuwenhoekiella aestuarii]|uniref:Type VI secretion system Hcp family effector n=1 Tax=Leeuwenhoekiella aestuarii TaxID=2249426 RepID=A0A4Q0NUL6_9FLAO|nr:type VI secretion system tube protein Hcp [Leeuwenhoekiella aestuarii]RXG15224.1 type VI secretion system Hcp family effector [Leeuwenhoekiella aestuarii]RXG17665.1 type VI secretion system Hcp family effector [Leeuwenhoekiella aestuarii]